jgi:hypothetical protein
VVLILCTHNAKTHTVMRRIEQTVDTEIKIIILLSLSFSGGAVGGVGGWEEMEPMIVVHATDSSVQCPEVTSTTGRSGV